MAHDRRRKRRRLLVLIVLLAGVPLAWVGFECTRAERLLRGAASEATLLRVRTGGLCHRRPELETTLFEISDRDEIRHAMNQIRARIHFPLLSCRCCGSPTIELYRDDELIAAASIHHGESLRFPGALGDTPLTSGSLSFLRQWLEAHSADWPPQTCAFPSASPAEQIPE